MRFYEVKTDALSFGRYKDKKKAINVKQWLKNNKIEAEIDEVYYQNS